MDECMPQGSDYLYNVYYNSTLLKTDGRIYQYLKDNNETINTSHTVSVKYTCHSQTPVLWGTTTDYDRWIYIALGGTGLFVLTMIGVGFIHAGKVTSLGPFYGATCLSFAMPIVIIVVLVKFHPPPAEGDATWIVRLVFLGVLSAFGMVVGGCIFRTSVTYSVLHMQTTIWSDGSVDHHSHQEDFGHVSCVQYGCLYRKSDLDNSKNLAADPTVLAAANESVQMETYSQPVYYEAPQIEQQLQQQQPMPPPSFQSPQQYQPNSQQPYGQPYSQPYSQPYPQQPYGNM
jgi:hypothetical protein